MTNINYKLKQTVTMSFCIFNQHLYAIDEFQMPHTDTLQVIKNNK